MLDPQKLHKQLVERLELKCIIFLESFEKDQTSFAPFFTLSSGHVSHTFASVTLVPAGEGGQARAGGAVGVSGALGAVGRAPEVV